MVNVNVLQFSATLSPTSFRQTLKPLTDLSDLLFPTIHVLKKALSGLASVKNRARVFFGLDHRATLETFS